MAIVDIKNTKSVVRDLASGAVLSTDSLAVKTAMIRKTREASLQYLASLPGVIDDLTSRLTKLESQILILSHQR